MKLYFLNKEYISADKYAGHYCLCQCRCLCPMFCACARALNFLPQACAGFAEPYELKLSLNGRFLLQIKLVYIYIKKKFSLFTMTSISNQ